MSIRLYVGNLPKEVERQELEAVFADFEGTISTKVITDRKTGKCRGFGFVTVKTDEQADELIEKFNGYEFKDSTLKIEKALPRSKSKAEEESEAAPSGDTPVAAGGGSPAPSRRKTKAPKRAGSSTGSTESDAVQPDPRWAQELEKLKQLLATQTANS
jgi:RNA recognition motif-containing protein